MSDHADLIARARYEASYLDTDQTGPPRHFVARLADALEESEAERACLADALESAATDGMRRDADLLNEWADEANIKMEDLANGPLTRDCARASYYRAAADRLRELADEAGRGGGA